MSAMRGRRVASPLVTDRNRPSTEASGPVDPIGDLWSLAPISYAALSGARTRDHVHPRGKASRPEFDATGRGRYRWEGPERGDGITSQWSGRASRAAHRGVGRPTNSKTVREPDGTQNARTTSSVV